MGRKKKGGGGMKGFLKTAKKATEDDASSTSSESEKDTQAFTPAPPPQEIPVNLDSETKAELRERHKREMNAAKKEAAKLGKKKKQEAAAVIESVKQRHEQELQQLKERTRHSSDSEDESKPHLELPEELSVELVPKSKPTGKKSKSQKRREKEAQKLEEREARIREDMEEMGVSERENEETLLKSRLDEMGFAIYEIRPDGHCLYKAIEDQLREISDTTQRLSFEALRKLAAAEMRSHADVYLPFFGDSSEGSFLEHCDKVESTAEWGGELEIQALSRQLQRTIIIYSVDLGENFVGEMFDGAPLRLCFMRHAYQLGAHYNSVRTKN